MLAISASTFKYHSDLYSPRGQHKLLFFVETASIVMKYRLDKRLNYSFEIAHPPVIAFRTDALDLNSTDERRAQ